LSITRFPFTLGRHPGCDHHLRNPLISRRHCAFTVHDGRVCVEDLGSRNGTRLNGEPVSTACPIKDGDRLEIASLAYQVRLFGAPAGRGPVPDASATQQEAGREDVLVVEDDASTAWALAVLLKSWGYAVRVARDGAEALQAAQTQPPDTVLLDIG